MVKSTSLAWRNAGKRYGCASPKTGQIISWTRIMHPLQGGFPYHFVLVELDRGGERVFGHFECGGGGDEKAPEMGMRVRTVFRVLRCEPDGGIIHYSYKFVRAQED